VAGEKDGGRQPNITVHVCVQGRALGEPDALVSDDATYVQLPYSRPGASYFPMASGTITLLADGTDGRSAQSSTAPSSWPTWSESCRSTCSSTSPSRCLLDVATSPARPA